MDYDDSSEERLLLDVNVYIAADFYDIPVLQELAAQKFEIALEYLWSSQQVFPAIEPIYTKTPSQAPIRNIIINTALLHRGTLMSPDTSMFPRLSGDIPELGRDVAMAMFAVLDGVDTKWDGFKKVQCQADACRHIWADSREMISDVDCPGCCREKHSWNKFQVD